MNVKVSKVDHVMNEIKSVKFVASKASLVVSFNSLSRRSKVMSKVIKGMDFIVSGATLVVSFNSLSRRSYVVRTKSKYGSNASINASVAYASGAENRNALSQLCCQSGGNHTNFAPRRCSNSDKDKTLSR